MTFLLGNSRVILHVFIYRTIVKRFLLLSGQIVYVSLRNQQVLAKAYSGYSSKLMP